MKPLKDIGTRVKPVRYPDFWAIEIYNEDLNPPEVTLYTDAERRELVREAIRQWELFRWETMEKNKGKFTENPMEAFVKKVLGEGL